MASSSSGSNFQELPSSGLALRKTYLVRADLATGNSVHGNHLCGSKLRESWEVWSGLFVDGLEVVDTLSFKVELLSWRMTKASINCFRIKPISTPQLWI